MSTIIKFLYKIRLVFLFLLLETAAMVLTVSNNAYHQAAFFNSSNRLSGGFYQQIAEMRYFLKLRTVNDSLAAENAQLREALLGVLADSNRSAWQISDSTARTVSYTYKSARVINNTTAFRNNFLTLNQGENDGIKPRMAVIGQHGVVGIVKDVSPNFSTVISLLNKNARISAKHLKSATTGTVVWEGGNYRVAKLIEIPIHVDLKKGDSIVTSPYSNIFPENIYIGKIIKINKPVGSSTYDISIQLGTDYRRLSFVQVIENSLQAERDSLESRLNYAE